MSDEDFADQIEAAREALYGLLRGQDPKVLAQRPPSGEWSVVENVRHLLYAEQLHLRRLMPRDFTWSAIGLPPGGRRPHSGAGSQPTDDIEQVLAAWDAVHGLVRHDAIPADAAGQAMQRNLRHLRAHTRIIASLIDERRREDGPTDGRRRNNTAR